MANEPLIEQSLILYGTQTGTAEDLAEQLAESFDAEGIANRVENMFDITLEEIKKHKRIFILVSTWGDGEPPDDAEGLHMEFSKVGSDSFIARDFAVFGLGDTGYEQFCQCGIEFDKFLEDGGGNRLLARVDADIDFDEDFEIWCESLTKKVGQLTAVSA